MILWKEYQSTILEIKDTKEIIPPATEKIIEEAEKILRDYIGFTSKAITVDSQVMGLSGGEKQGVALISVDFPAPEEPRRTTNSPSWSEKLISRTAKLSSSNDTDSCWMLNSSFIALFGQALA